GTGVPAGNPGVARCLGQGRGGPVTLRTVAEVVAPPRGFRRLSLTGWGLFFFAVSASAPLTVLVGGVLGAYAVTGVVQVPAAFILLTAVLLLVWIGHVGMARHVRHSGP